MWEVYLGPYQTSMMDHFFESSLRLKSVNYFRKKLHRRCIRFQNTPLNILQIKPFLTKVPLMYLLKNIMMFSVGIEVEHWLKTG